MTKPHDLDELDVLLNDATERPWVVCRESKEFGGLGMPVCRMDSDDTVTVGHRFDWGPTASPDADAALIAAAVNALPSLLARVRAAEARGVELEAAARAVLDDNDLAAILAREDAFARWVLHRANLELVLKESA